MNIDINKKYRTSNGTPVRIICTDRKQPHSPIIAIVGEDEDRVHAFSADGVADHCSPQMDLVEVREPVEIRAYVDDKGQKAFYHFTGSRRALFREVIDPA